jgi:translation initiation factor 2 subunit 1
MAAPEEAYPDTGDLVVATVKNITPYGAYVALDEYNGREGLIHVSEVSTTWVKNIRDHVREGQKLVLKVLRVNRQRGEVDLSLRRVTGREKAEKMLQWKRDKKAEAILKSTAEKLSADENALKNVRDLILQQYDSVYDALEKSIDLGEEVFTKLGLQPEWARTLTENAKLKIKLKKTTLTGTIELTSHKPNGVSDIKTALLNAEKVKTDGTDIRIYTIGAPKYRFEVVASDYSDAETLMNEAIEEAISYIKRAGGEGHRTD